MATTNHLAITLVEQSQAQKEITVNAALTRLDAMLNSGAKSRSTNTPPGSPAAGDVYIVGSAPTGAWAGQAGKITYFDQLWKFITPLQGAMLWVNDEGLKLVFNGSSWAIYTPGAASYNDLAGNYTLAASDAGKTLRFTGASAATLTLPNNLPQGFLCSVVQVGAGQITFTASAGANRRNRQSHSKTAGQWAVCQLQVQANSGGSSADYVLSGDTAV